MPQDTTSDQDPDDNDTEFVEVDPSGRYGRYKEILGKGAFKKVYRGFDELEGIEVAWNQVKVADLLRNSVDLERLYSEVHLLKTLKHKNIIKFYSSWVDTKNENINFITEIFTSGTLRQYRKKHKHVDLRALKKWSKQILEGLLYLHSHDPPVIHRDLKCDNIFVNGNQGEVKIGDLGLAAILLHAHSAHSVIGTPEFMAPELYEEEYNELVDIYAFGMCLLELVTFEYPYSECANAAQIYKKVTLGVKPAALEKVTDSRVKIFIEKCIANVSTRLSAKELLTDPFLQSDEDSESINRSSHGEVKDVGDKPQHIDVGRGGKDPSAETSMDFTVQGQRKDLNTIFLKLKIADSTGHVRNIHFPFDIEVDTALAVAGEMVEELDLTDQDVSAIAAMIDAEIQSHIPDWAPGDTSVDHHSNEELTDPRSTLPEMQDEGNLVLERTPSGRKYWSNSLKPGDECSPFPPGASHVFSHVSSLTEDDFVAGSGPAECCNDGKGLDSATDHIHSINDSSEAKESNGLVESPYGESNATDDQDTCGEDHLGKSCCVAYEDLTTHIGYEDFATIVEKLDNLLKQQQEELEELKKKHDAAILHLLDGLSPEIRRMALDLCKCNAHQPGE